MNNIISRKKTPIPVSIRQRRDPFSFMQNVFDSAFRDFSHPFDFMSISKDEFENLTINPSIDIVDDKDQFKIEVEMPGVKAKYVKLSVSDDALTISAEKKVSKENKDKNYLVRERGYGSYTRTVLLPDSADIDKIKATFKKGVLWVEIPKKETATKRHREVEVQATDE